MAGVRIAPGDAQAAALGHRFAPARFLGAQLDTPVARAGLKFTFGSLGFSSGTSRFTASIRNCTWSLPAASDSSCMKLCCTKTWALSPGARHGPVGIFSGIMVTARRRLRRLDRIHQIAGIVAARHRLLAVGGEGDEMLGPGVQPAVLVDRGLELVIAGGRKKSWMKSSSRVHCTLTGPLTFCAITAASTM